MCPRLVSRAYSRAEGQNPNFAVASIDAPARTLSAQLSFSVTMSIPDEFGLQAKGQTLHQVQGTSNQGFRQEILMDTEVLIHDRGRDISTYQDSGH